MDGELKPYQERAVKFALDKHQCALLMPTGTGKTVVSLTYLKILNEKAVIVAPASIIRQNVWQNENEKFKLNVDITTDLRQPGKVFLTSYDWIKNNEEVLEDYSIIVLDEAHCISDTETIRYRNLSKIVKSIDRVVLLAGYPVENKLNEIFVLSLITDVLGKNYYHFLYKFFNVIRYSGRIMKTTPKHGSFEKIVSLIKDFVFIVDKSEAVPNTVKKETIVVRYELTDYQKNIINSIADFGEYSDDKINVRCKNTLVAFGKLMQVVSGFIYNVNDNKELYPIYLDGDNPKLRALDKVIGGHDNFLLWYWFDAEQAFLESYKERCRLSKIQTDSRGLNLQQYNFAIYFSVPLSGGMFMQSQDRIHRMGRTRDVVSIVLVPEGEFGTKLLGMLDRKAKLTKKFISELLRTRA